MYLREQDFPNILEELSVAEKNFFEKVFKLSFKYFPWGEKNLHKVIKNSLLLYLDIRKFFINPFYIHST